MATGIAIGPEHPGHSQEGREGGGGTRLNDKA